MPYTAAEWATGKAEVLEILKMRAADRGMLAYSELSRLLRTIVLPYDDPAMDAMLGEISTEEDQQGRGMLSVIVAHKVGDMEPGSGFYALAEKLGHRFSDRQAFWISELHKVHNHWANRRP